MRVKVKLMGVLKKKTPRGGTLELAAGATLADALAALGVHDERITAVSLNGAIERDFTRALSPEDDLTVLPPSSGG